MRAWMLRGLGALALLLALVATGLAGQPAPALASGTLEPWDCGADEFVDDLSVRCYLFTVPQDWNNPSGPTVELPVAVVGPERPRPGTAPLFLFQGGPGGMTIPVFLPYLEFMPDFSEGRTIVLLEQRGTPLAEPDLVCEATGELNRHLEFVQRCKDRLLAEGIDITAYTTRQNAADVNALRQALGYGTVDLYGVSYGSLLAQEVVRQYPGTVRAMVLDAVVSPTVSPWKELPRNFNEVLNRMGTICKANARCASETDFEKDLFVVIDRLDANPRAVAVRDPFTREIRQYAMTGDDVISAVLQSLYDPELFLDMFPLVAAARDGDYTFFEFFARATNTPPRFASVSMGMYYSVICQEFQPFTADEIGRGDIRTRIGDYMARDLERLNAACRLWNVPPRWQDTGTTVSSDVPTLLLSGAFDAITPARFGDLVNSGLSRGQHFVLPFGSHVAFGDYCAEELTLAFLADPGARLNSDCAIRR